MTKQQPRKRSSMIFLVLGLAFLVIGLATDQTAFTWIAIAFVLISLLTGGRWLRRRK
jgi:membrane protein implicated in regulation of membrane protease activity